MSKPPTTYPLPADTLSQQISTVDLLLAMFPDPSEIEISSSDLELVNSIRDADVDATSPVQTTPPPDINLALHVLVDETHSVQVNVTVPLRAAEPEASEPPGLGFTLRQPPWLGRAGLADLVSKLPGDIFSALETLREEALTLLPQSPPSPSTTEPQSSNREEKPLVRVWFYFPSLSTRSKRNDMVHWAPSHHLTGFILAGKPGLLCLEGFTQDIDVYMNEIKTLSWSDIPAYQKKVSERFREVGVLKRVFEGMREVTGALGGMHGHRGNRGDMAALECWLRGKGLGDAFESVILQSS